MVTRHPKHSEDRGSSPHFAGRGPELARFRRFLDNADQRAGILLVTGVPGIGKSELLERFDDECQQAGVAVLKWDTRTLLEGDSQVFMHIAEAMGKSDEGARIAHMEPRESGHSWRVASVGYGETTDHVRRELLLHSMLTALSKNSPNPLVVLIDEVQNIDDEGANLLRVLHEGRHGCPVLVVGAGLQHAPKVLRRHGISRTTRPIELGLLSPVETYEAVAEGYLASTGMELTDETTELLVERSMCFPQHVAGYLQGAVMAYENHGDVVGDGLEEAVKHGDEVRRIYYGMRLDAAGNTDDVLELVDLFDDRESMTISGVEKGLRNKGVADGSATVAKAIEAGILTLNQDRVLSFDIPSFRRHTQDMASSYRARMANEIAGAKGHVEQGSSPQR